MNRKLVFLIFVLLPLISKGSQEITLSDAKKMYKVGAMNRVSVHDPSIVWEPESETYYLFGTHRGQVKSKDLRNWEYILAPWGVLNSDGSVRAADNNNEPFVTHRVKTVNVGGRQVTFGNFDALSWTRAFDASWSLDGNMWAPDVIYNKQMKKWCMYLSLDGGWGANNCLIVLLTSDTIDGTYVYEGPVVYSGFYSATDERISFKKTDLELAIGTQSVLPSRYTHDPGNTWPNCIDPCVFYDESGNLLMCYGSFFGGIWMLELDEKTGLRDYNVGYGSDFDSRQTAVTLDPYFGRKIAGGCGATGEGSYIEHIGEYYYLFVTHGALGADQGYEMRVFRSSNPHGPYVGPDGTPAVLDYWVNNVGIGADHRGEKVVGAYGNWGFMGLGEVAQGHNSIISAPDGRTYLVYHTRFHDNGGGHEVRVHQVFLNRNGWLCVAPFEYTGETTTDEDISSTAVATKSEIVGTYNLIIHRYDMDFVNMDQSEPIKINLLSTGKITGDKSGTWSMVSGTSYITLSFDDMTFSGVMVEQEMEPTTIKALSFTACSSSGLNIWGYKMRNDYALAYTLNNMSLPVTDGMVVKKNLNLYEIELQDNVSMKWTSSNIKVINTNGRYNPEGLTESVPVELQVTLTCGDYFWTNTYNVTASDESIPAGDMASGLVAYYDFNNSIMTNQYNVNEKGLRLHKGTGSSPTLELNKSRDGKVLHTTFGIAANNSYARFPNSLNASSPDGVTIAFWLYRDDDNLWDALCSFLNDDTGETLFMTGNAYIGYKKDDNNWFDICHPNDIETNLFSSRKWNFITMTISLDGKLKLYVNGFKKSLSKFSGMQNGKKISSISNFDFTPVLEHISNCKNFYIGHGSPWGSTPASFDDLLIYNRELGLKDVYGLNTLANRIFDFSYMATSVDEITLDTDSSLLPEGDAVYDLNGRLVMDHYSDSEFSTLRSGIYVTGGRKIMKR